jgi:hypothetical protein
MMCLAALAVAFTVSQPAHADHATPPPVPHGIQVPAGNQAFLEGDAISTQDYICLPSSSGFTGHSYGNRGFESLYGESYKPDDPDMTPAAPAMQMNPYTDRNRPNRGLVRFAGLRRTDFAFGRAEMCAEKPRPGYCDDFVLYFWQRFHGLTNEKRVISQHPAVVGHDPERRERCSQRHHRGREQM